MSINQADAAQLRLAYVQHPFPAQGLTTDTTRLIVSAHATRQGTYVALTRAREETHLYAGEPVDSDLDGDRLRALAERISQTEPDLPSLAIPIERDRTIAVTNGRGPIESDRPARQQAAHHQLGVHERASADESISVDGATERDIQPTVAEPDAARNTPVDPSTPCRGDQSTPQRRWPRRPGTEPSNHLRESIGDNSATARPPGWEP